MLPRECHGYSSVEFPGFELDSRNLLGLNAVPSVGIVAEEQGEMEGSHQFRIPALPQETQAQPPLEFR